MTNEEGCYPYAERNARYWKQNLAVCVFGSFTTAVSLTMLLPSPESLGYSQSSQYAGQVIGPLMSGALATHFGMRSVLIATSAMTFIGAAANCFCQRSVHERSSSKRWEHRLRPVPLRLPRLMQRRKQHSSRK